jgi:flagellar biosynthesis GTPase FlhF
VCPEFEHDLMYTPTFKMINSMDNDALFKLAKEILPFDIDMKDRYIVEEMVYDRIYSKNLRNWLSKLETYVEQIKDCADARQKHYEQCIVTGLWKKGQHEDRKHKYWREAFNNLCVNCEHTLAYWTEYLKNLDDLVKLENKSIAHHQFEQAIKNEEKRQELENERIERLMKQRVFNPDEIEESKPTKKVPENILKLRKEKIKQMKEYKEYLRQLEDHKRQQKEMRKQEEKKLLDNIETVQKKQSDAYVASSRATPALEEELGRVNLEQWLKDLLVIMSSSPLNKEAYDKLKLKAHEFLSVSHVTNRFTVAFAELIVNAAFGENTIIVDRVMGSALLFGPYVNDDDLHKDSYVDFMKGLRNEPELSAIQKNIYFTFVMSMCKAYIKKMIELASPDPYWNRRLYTQILSLLNRPMMQTIYQQLYWAMGQAPEKDKKYYNAFLYEMNNYTNYYVYFFNEAINAAYGKGDNSAWCHSVGYHLKRYTEFVVKQRPEAYVEIKDTANTKLKLFIKAFDQQTAAYKQLQKYIKRYNKICMIE